MLHCITYFHSTYQFYLTIVRNRRQIVNQKHWLKGQKLLTMNDGAQRFQKAKQLSCSTIWFSINSA